MNTGAPRHGFPKRYRLRTREQFLQVQSSPKRSVSRYLVILYKENDVGHVRVGITVSRRHGNAVTRNRIKRVLRAALRLLMPSLQSLPCDLVIIPKAGAVNVPMAALLADLSAALERQHRNSGR